MKVSTKEAAHGKWYSLLTHFGVPTEFLRDLHGPCPLCGGTDRFRYDDRNGNGDYFCGNDRCGAGDGFMLLGKFKGWDFAETAKQIDAIVGNVADVKPSAPPHDPEAVRARLNKMWREAKSNSPIVRDYLNRRGITKIPDCLRGHPGLYYQHAGVRYGTYPAMLAMFHGADGSAQSIHRTYMIGDDVGDVPRKKMEKVVTPPLTGGAIRLWPVAKTLGFAEGIETALSATQLTGIPTWATYSAGNLRAVIVPPEVEHIVIFADNDLNGVGQAAAEDLRVRCLREGREAEVRVAGLERSMDWNDVLTDMQRT